MMKLVAVGRKNWLFIGSISAGRQAANLLTLVSSASRNDLDVWIYTKSLLNATLSGSTDHASFRPDTWVQSHPEHIRCYRVEERRDRADRKQRQRAAEVPRPLTKPPTVLMCAYDRLAPWEAILQVLELAKFEGLTNVRPGTKSD